MEKLSAFLDECSQDLTLRRRKEDFTRNRQLTFRQVALLILSAMKRVQDLELKDFFDTAGCDACPSGSAFSRARHKMASEFFVRWLKRQTDIVYECPHETFQGYRLFGVDGSLVYIPDNPDTRKAFPPLVNVGDPMQARVLCWYDMLNDHAACTLLAPSTRAETDMAYECLGNFGARDILIYDRFFAGWGLMRVHQLKGVHFLMRCKVSFSNQVKAFVASGLNDAVVEFRASFKSVASLRDKGVKAKRGERLTVRLLRVDIGGKEPEILATSLMDTAEFPLSVFKGLYFRRWGVETFFDRLKNKFQIEVFSGKSPESVRQDLMAMVFLANLQSMVIRAAKPEVDKAAKRRKHGCQVNRNKNLGLLSR
ncbi:MAG: IS4 family transposase [Bacteroidetes bacterium]|nr:IS4 family transposase [Bacteroidota bacterium]